MLGWMKHKLESRLPGEISITSDMQMTPPMAPDLAPPPTSLLQVDGRPVALPFLQEPLFY